MSQGWLEGRVAKIERDLKPILELFGAIDPGIGIAIVDDRGPDDGPGGFPSEVTLSNEAVERLKNLYCCLHLFMRSRNLGLPAIHMQGVVEPSVTTWEQLDDGSIKFVTR